MGRGGKRQSNKPKNCICSVCSKHFVTTGVGAKPKYCSEECKSKANLQKRGIEGICQQCGISFVSLSRNAKYCSKACYGQTLVKDEPIRTKHKKTCPICVNEFETIKKTQICCSSKCGRKQGHESLKRYYICKHCGKPFWRENAFRMKYCTPECQKAAIRAQTIERHKDDPLPVVYNKICVECGTEFDTSFPNHIYCSSTCGYNANLRLKREQWAADYAPRTFSCKECGTEVATTCGDKRSEFCCQGCSEKYERRVEHTTERHKNYSREFKKLRQKQLAEAFIEAVSYEAIYEREGGICAICGLPVLKDKFADNNWSGTIDHIIPLSKGGKHSMFNCQLSHRVCNSLKSNSLDFDGIDWKIKAQTDNYWNLKYLQGLEVLDLKE